MRPTYLNHQGKRMIRLDFAILGAVCISIASSLFTAWAVYALISMVSR